MVEANVYLPSPRLRDYVHHYWTFRSDDRYFSKDIFPTGLTKWMFHRLRPLTINGECDEKSLVSVTGQNLQPLVVETYQPVDLIFVFFQPYVMNAILNIPSFHFTQGNVDIEDMEMPEFSLLKRMVLETPDTRRAIDLIEDFIVRMLSRNKDLYNVERLKAAFMQMACDPMITVAGLADVACFSERQLRRVFNEEVGISPKQMIRVNRFSRSLRMLTRMEGEDFSELINALGYTDHSHFNKDFRSFTGKNPTELLKWFSAVRNKADMRVFKSYHELSKENGH